MRVWFEDVTKATFEFEDGVLVARYVGNFLTGETNVVWKGPMAVQTQKYWLEWRDSHHQFQVKIPADILVQISKFQSPLTD